MPTTAPAQTKQQPLKTRKPEPREYLFRLTERFPEFYEGSSPYPARIFIKNEDDILWAYKNGVPLKLTDTIGKDDEIEYRPRRIRYVSGLPSIFADEQETENRPLPERVTANSDNKDKLAFHRGENRVDVNDRARRNFLHCMNQCKNQHPNARQFHKVNAKFEMVDFAYADEQKVLLGQLKEKAYEIARTARTEEMIPHAKYLNIPFNHSATDEEVDIDAVRADYKDKALSSPQLFLDTFNDPKVKIVYQIKTLVENGDITVGGVAPGQVHWVKTGTLVTVLPPEREPIDYLADFAITKAGEEFANNLRAYGAVK